MGGEDKPQYRQKETDKPDRRKNRQRQKRNRSYVSGKESEAKIKIKERETVLLFSSQHYQRRLNLTQRGVTR